MRVLLTAVAFSLLSFLAGVAGDLSVVRESMEARAAPVVLTLPQMERFATVTAAARPLRGEGVAALAAAPALLPKAQFAPSAEELAALDLAKGKAA